MYAVIETSGRQYRVELGSEIELDRLDAEPGSTIELGRVLLVADGTEAHIGQPVVDGARVTGEVLRQDRGEKIVVFKYRPKARRRVKHGHRSDLTIVRVSDIVLNGRSAATEADAESKKEAAARKAAEKEAQRQAAADQALAAKLAEEQQAQQAADEAPKKKPATKVAATKTAATKTTTAKAGKAKAAADAEADAESKDASSAKPARSARTTSAAKPASTRSTKKDE
jgi:large subunit ribosomal protein L21